MRTLTALFSISPFLFTSGLALEPITARIWSNQGVVSEPKSLSFDDARLVLAHRVGAEERFAVKDDRDVERLKELNEFPAVKSGKAFFGEGEKAGQIVVLVTGTGSKGMMEGGYEYAVEGAPSATAMQGMVEDLIDSKANVDERWDLNNGAFIEVQRISPQSQFPAISLAPLPDLDESVKQHHDLKKRIPGMDGANGNFKEDMLTLASFNAWVKDNGIPYGSIMYLTINSLGEISKVYGTDSNEFAAAFSSMRWTINSLIESTTSRITLIEQPTSSLPVSKRQYVAAEVPLRSSAPIIESATPITISKKKSVSPNPFRNLPRCFTTEEACTKNTNDCSGHGTCKSVVDKGTPGKCFQCVCKPTVNGKKSTVWGGQACQKKDISVELNLFIGLAVVFIVFLFSGVSLLSSLGAEELPGVLAAGVPTKKSGSS